MRSILKKAVALCIVGVLVAASLSTAVAADSPKEVPFEEGKTPPAPEMGKVWCLVSVPAQFKTVTNKVQIQPAASYFEPIPAVWGCKDECIQTSPAGKRAVYVPATFKTVEEKILVQPESVKLCIEPAEWKTVQKTVEVSPAYEDICYTPATYKTVQQKIQVAPATTETVRVRCKPAQKCETNRACYTKVQRPAQFRTICVKEQCEPGKEVKRPVAACTKTICVMELVKPETVKKITVPAKYTTICKRVLDKPAHFKYVDVPACSTTVKVRTIVKPEDKKKISIPAKYTTVCNRELVSPAKMVWRLTDGDLCGRAVSCVKKYGSVPAAAVK